MRWSRTLLITIKILLLLMIFSWYYRYIHLSISPPKQTLITRNDQRWLRLKEKYQLLVNLTAWKGKTLSNQRMIYSCQSFCGGWGDRLRGILSTYILALLTDRQFVIDMNYPCAISRVLQPNFVNWTWFTYPKSANRTRLTINTMPSWQKAYRNEIADTIKSKNLLELWSSYDDIYISSNSDYMFLAFRNIHLANQSRKLLGRIPLSHATMQNLFSFIYELLFQPSLAVIQRVDQILFVSRNQHLICLHVRIGKNPTNPFDHAFTARVNTTQTMLTFTDRYMLNKTSSFVFITSDSGQAVSDVLRHYPQSSMTIVGPILHIDRFDRRSSTICDGYIKVLADFYMLGECQTSLLSRSGFSSWANKRRTNEHENLYIYNENTRAMHRS